MRSPDRLVDPDATAVEVPVTTAGDTSDLDAPATEHRPRPSLGTALVVGAGLIAVIVIGSVAVQVWSDDRSDGGDEPSSVDDEPPSILGTPDTLPPRSAPTRTGVTDPIATRPPLELRIIDAAVDADLAVGVARLGGSADLMSETFVDVGSGRFVQRIEVRRDGATDRIEAIVETTGLREQVIVDAHSGVGYVRRGPSSWETFEATDRVVEFWDRLLRGPLTSDLLADDGRSDVRVGPVVGVEQPVGSAPSPARAFRIETVAGELAGWTPYPLGPLDGADTIVPTSTVELVALVAPGDELVEVRWTVPFGTTSQVVLHRHDAPADATIDLPAPADITGPATDWIIVPR